MFRMPGKVVITTDISVLDAPRDFSFSGSTDGTTVSMIWKQKSPHNSQAKRAPNPNRV